MDKKNTNVGSFKKGYTPWNKGKKLSKSHCEKLRLSHLGKKQVRTEEGKKSFRDKMSGENHPNWKENPDYQSLHSWVYDNFGKANKCEMSGCKYPRVGDKGIILKKPKRYEWSNKTGIYNRERKNWWQLCPSCHRKYDYKNNIRKNKNV